VKTVKDVRDWLVTLADAQVEGVWSVRPMVRIGREDLLRAIEVLEPFKDLPDAPNPGLDQVTPKAVEMIGMVRDCHDAAQIAGLIEERDQFGRAKYGQSLMTFDGRDTAKEIEDELADAIQYTAKGLVEGSVTEYQWDWILQLIGVTRDMIIDHPTRRGNQCDDM